MRVIIQIGLMAMILAARAAAQDSARIHVPAPSGARPWTHLQFKNAPAEFQFAVVADLTGGNRSAVFRDAVRKLNLMRPEFVMSVGDFIEGYTQDAALVERQWDVFDEMVRQLEAPFFFVPGNHDVTNAIQRAIWTRRRGPTSYHFVYRNVLFLVLDTEALSDRGLDEAQRAFVTSVLQADPQVRWTLIFVHKPLWAIAGAQSWSQIEQILGRRDYTVFSGHWHRYQKYVRDGRRYIDLGTTGAGLRQEGAMTGAFDHFTWVTMTDEGPRIANVQIDGVWDEDVVTEASAALLRPVYEGEAVQAEPVFTESSTFARGETRLTVRNRSDLPMAFTGRFWQHAFLRPTLHALDAIIPPKETRDFQIGLAVESTRPVADLAPVSLAWNVGFQPPGARPLEVEGALDLRVIQVLPCARREAPVVVDGRLDEWKSLPFLGDKPELVRVDPDTYLGPQDGSFRFALEHDEQYVYFAVAVTDDAVVRRLASSPFKRDAIEILLDARPDPARSAYMGKDDPKEFLIFRMAPGEDPVKPLMIGRDRMPAGLQVACAYAEPGIVAEIAVPVSYLDAKQEGPWSRLRLNVAFDDFDDPNADVSAQVWWKPWWRTKESYAGSGTFGKR